MQISCACLSAILYTLLIVQKASCIIIISNIFWNCIHNGSQGKLFKIKVQCIVTGLVTVDGVLDWQLNLLQSYTQVQYNWVSPDSLSLPTHDWIYHNNSAAFVTAATLVTGELQVPFLPFLGYQPTNLLTLQQLLQLRRLLQTLFPKTTPLSNNSEVYDLWTDCRGDSAFGIGCLAIT
jgi:hypothetical protein